MDSDIEFRSLTSLYALQISDKKYTAFVSILK